MDNRPIGVFDSGVGGLTVVRELRRILPQENIVYFGDTGRVPYGTRSRSTITRYTQQDIAFLESRDVKMIVIACGTASSVISKELGAKIKVPYTGVILPAAQAACSLTQKGVIGVIGTTATIRSGAYGKSIRSINSACKVIARDCPLFVPLVENGLIEPQNPITRLTAQMYLEPLMQEGIDTLILGCTHYPLLYDLINDVIGYSAVLIDPGKETAHFVQNFLTTNNLLREEESPAVCQYFVSDSADQFTATASKFLGADLGGNVQQIEIEAIQGA